MRKQNLTGYFPKNTLGLGDVIYKKVKKINK